MLVKKILLCLCVLSVLAACGGHERKNSHSASMAENGSNKSIVFAFLPGTDNDDAYRQGIELALAEANDKKINIGGRSAHFTLDTATKQQSLHMDRAIGKQHWSVLMGYAGLPEEKSTHIALPVMALGDDAAYVASDSPNSESTPVFHLQPTVVQQGQLLARYLLQQNDVRRVAIISNGQHPLLVSALHDQLQQGGKNTTVYVLDKVHNTQLQQLMAQLQTNVPDLVFYSGDGKSAVRLLRRMQQARLLVPVMLTAEAKTNRFIQQAGDYAQASMAMVPGLALTQIKNNDVFAQAYRQRFEQDPNIAAVYGYDAAWVVITAMKLANSAEPASFLPKLQSLNMATGLLSGPLTFDNRGWRNEAAMTIYQVEDGEWKLADSLTGTPNQKAGTP
ncbi:ABC transporter substrate-binding protein [Snodgrassella sp. CFCC 13594]|uniref:ABC transporter substrate-binding protein n=1 Tax=Snodgrassella sp. CFCC 13594 TaxID=1775559 RepID=UPI00082C0B03|nr:ABC transporter substrate-binding protein [Snodgrassella sp. CFCC 13594]